MTPLRQTDVRMEDGSELPAVDFGGELRVLARLPTPAGHPMLALPSWDDHANAANLPDVKFEDIKPFSRVCSVVPILDQDGRGACVAHAVAAAAMIARALSGAPHVDLSAWFLYSNIDRGVDAGSNAGDAIQSLQKDGICAFDPAHYKQIRPAGLNDACRKQARRFVLRPDGAVRIKGFREAVVAAYLGYAVVFDTCAGGPFNTDSEGVCRYIPGPNNHELMAGEEYDGKYLGGRNSWGESWGVKGRCKWQPRHLDDSSETYAVRFFLADPDDPEMPPALA